MNAIGLLFFFANAIALLTVRRKWAPVPLLVGCCYMTMGQGVHIGPISMPMIRLLLAVGLLRVMIRSERPAGRFNRIDWLMLGLGGWILFASLFHNGVNSGPIFAGGVVFNLWLVYFLTRTFCRTTDELTGLIVVIAVLLVPIALEMVQEKLTGKNLFSMLFGGVSEDVVMRNDRLRARGPFRHAILAGTVGAACFPLMMAVRKQYPKIAKMGMATTVFMVLASASSGPVMSLFFASCALVFWRFRQWARYLPTVGVLGYIALDLVMTKPAYHLIARIDLAGGSTGWHRARLIESSLQHLSEWWFAGTDFTRHWMPTGNASSPYHTDITNYYLMFGVWAGLPAVLLVLAMLWTSFRWVGKAVRAKKAVLAQPERYLIWCLGAGLFAHAATSISVSYYDQSFVFFWFNVAVISSFHSMLIKANKQVASAPPVAAEPVSHEAGVEALVLGR